jgi:hypothetical protein
VKFRLNGPDQERRRGLRRERVQGDYRLEYDKVWRGALTLVNKGYLWSLFVVDSKVVGDGKLRSNADLDCAISQQEVRTNTLNHSQVTPKVFPRGSDRKWTVRWFTGRTYECVLVACARTAKNAKLPIQLVERKKALWDSGNSSLQRFEVDCLTYFALQIKSLDKRCDVLWGKKGLTQGIAR